MAVNPEVIYRQRKALGKKLEEALQRAGETERQENEQNYTAAMQEAETQKDVLAQKGLSRSGYAREKAGALSRTLAEETENARSRQAKTVNQAERDRIHGGVPVSMMGQGYYYEKEPEHRYSDRMTKALLRQLLKLQMGR